MNDLMHLKRSTTDWLSILDFRSNPSSFAKCSIWNSNHKMCPTRKLKFWLASWLAIPNPAKLFVGWNMYCFQSYKSYFESHEMKTWIYIYHNIYLPERKNDIWAQTAEKTKKNEEKTSLITWAGALYLPNIKNKLLYHAMRLSSTTRSIRLKPLSVRPVETEGYTLTTQK